MSEIPLVESTPLHPPQRSRPRWYLPFSILLSVVFLYFAIRGVTWSEFTKQLLNCRVEYLIPAIAITLVNYFVRSQRWGILLRAKQNISPGILFWACGVGYMGNNFLPFRSGDVIRSIALGQNTGISKVYVFATTVTERIIDAIFLIFLGMLLIPTIGKAPDWLPSAMWGLGLLSFIAIIILLLAPRMENLFIKILNSIPSPSKWRFLLIKFLTQFLQGAAAFQNLGRAGLFLFMTCGIWLLDGIAVMFSSRAFSMEFNLNQSLLLLVGLGLSSAIPSAPGYVGVYQFVTVTILAIYGYPQSQALAFILVAQATGMLLTLGWGLLGLWRIKWTGVRKDELSTG
jgi:uncharacterized protein (TIRG00374 family)